MSEDRRDVSAALLRIRELDQTDNSGVEYDMWGTATLTDMSSYNEAIGIAEALNAKVGYEAIRVVPRKRKVEYKVFYMAGHDGNMHPAGEGEGAGEVICGFDVISFERATT